MIDKDPTRRDRDVNFDVNNRTVEIKGSVAVCRREDAGRRDWLATAGASKDMANGLEICLPSVSTATASTMSGQQVQPQFAALLAKTQRQ